MAKNKKSMIGFDPLAWLDEEPADNDTVPNKSRQTEKRRASTVKAQAASKKAASDKSTSKKVASKKTAGKKAASTVKQIQLLGHELDETALLKGHQLAVDKLDTIVEAFYKQLFNQYPEVQSLFAHSDLDAQGKKLQAAIQLLVEHLHQPEALEQALRGLGQRHQSYGALPVHYPLVVELLLVSFKQQLGRRWTRAVNSAWQTLLTAASTVMCDAYEDAPLSEEVEEPAADPVQSENLTYIEPDESQPMRAESLLELQVTQDISHSATLKAEMLSLLESQQTIQIDASRVERIDGSALQLLCALFLQAENNGVSLQWIEPSDALLQAAKYSGVTTLLNLQS